MPKFKGGESRAPLDYKTNRLYRRPLNITADNRISTPNCGHWPAPVRNVTTPDGEAAYVCRECYGYVLRVELKTVIRRQFLALFRNLLPLGSLRGAPAGRGAA